jgi:two-component system sensor histidine kinase AlgZ
MNSFLYNDFIFSSRYQVWRHIIYWAFHISVWAAFWVIAGVPIPYERQLLYMTVWTPVFILFGYPLIYGAIPFLLLKGKVLQFFLTVLAWGAAGLYLDEAARYYIVIPFQKAIGLDGPIPSGPMASCYLCMTTSAAIPMIIKFFKLLTSKQKAWVQAKQEQITTELQLLKAQVHPHFLFNTLNNIYSFSLERSPKTPDLIQKLSSLLSYMLSECKTDEVRLEKEIEVMKNYIDLERERYGDKIEITWNVEGDIKDKFIAPLLLLPFLENAFKHGTSEQLEKSRLSVDISVQQDVLRCNIINSKNKNVPYSEKGIGIANVKKRLEFIYPGNYKLSLNDEGQFYVVSLLVNLSKAGRAEVHLPLRRIAEVKHLATPLSVYK